MSDARLLPIFHLTNSEFLAYDEPVNSRDDRFDPRTGFRQEKGKIFPVTRDFMQKSSLGTGSCAFVERMRILHCQFPSAMICAQTRATLRRATIPSQECMLARDVLQISTLVVHWKYDRLGLLQRMNLLLKNPIVSFHLCKWSLPICGWTRQLSSVLCRVCLKTSQDNCWYSQFKT